MAISRRLKNLIPRTRGGRWRVVICGTLVLVPAIDMSWVRYRRQINVSPATTAITMPLTPQGLPDYIAALNVENSKGVTLENNAAPLLLQVGGTSEAPQYWRDAVLPQLGLSPAGSPSRSSPEPDWLKVGTFEAGSDNDPLIYDKPWKAADHPRWAAWVEQKTPEVALLDLASRRSHYFIPKIQGQPFVSDGEWAGGAPHAIFPVKNDVQLRIGERDYPRFKLDVLIMCRLARLFVQGPAPTDYLVGESLEHSAYSAVKDAIMDGAISAAQARDMQAALGEFPPLARPEGQYDHFMRWAQLNTLCYGATYGTDRMENLRTWDRLIHEAIIRGDDFQNLAEPKQTLGDRAAAIFVPLNYNEALRNANRLQDRIVAAIRLTRFTQRIDALTALDHELSPYQKASNYVFSGRPAAVLMSDAPRSLIKVLRLEQMCQTQIDLVRLALALTLYHEMHQEYPGDLEVLHTEGLMSEIPLDSFSDKPLIYRKIDAGYLLYSVSYNGTDEGGEIQKDMPVKVSR